MRVLIVTQYFFPENFRINELAFELARRGYHVDALVGIPNYPGGQYFKGYGLLKKRHENVGGVNIYRCFQFQRGKKAALPRVILNYLSFVISATLWVLFFFAWRKRYDAIIGFEPSPIIQLLPAVFLGRIKKTKVLNWIQDIWPDSMTGRLNPNYKKIFFPPLNLITEYIYKHSTRILVSSKGMGELVCRNYDHSSKIEYVPNWCDDFSHGKNDLNLEFPKGFNIMMAGNISESIGPDDVIGLCEELKIEKGINIVFVGKGAKLNYMQNRVKELNLSNVYFMGAFPYEKMGDIYAKCDALLLTLRPTIHKYLDVTVPSRLQAYLSSGKPIFSMIGAGAAEIIRENDCGYVVNAGEYKELANIILNTYLDKDQIAQKGKNSRITYEKYFTIEKGVEHFENLINS